MSIPYNFLAIPYNFLAIPYNFLMTGFLAGDGLPCTSHRMLVSSDAVLWSAMNTAGLSNASDEESTSDSDDADDASWSETSSSVQPLSGQQGPTTANTAPVAGSLATMLQADMIEASRHDGAVASQPTGSLAHMISSDALLQPQHVPGEPSTSHGSMQQPHREVERGAACDNMHHGNANATTVGCSNTVDSPVHDCRSDRSSAGSPCRHVLILRPRRPAPAAAESCCHACAATAANPWTRVACTVLTLEMTSATTLILEMPLMPMRRKSPVQSPGEMCAPLRRSHMCTLHVLSLTLVAFVATVTTVITRLTSTTTKMIVKVPILMSPGLSCLSMCLHMSTPPLATLEPHAP